MPTVIPVRFTFPRLLAPKANRVALLGPFNGWDPRAHRLTKTTEGDWCITVFLPPGWVVYCFSIDGVSWLDPHDEGRVPNGRGREYSVRYVHETWVTPPTSKRKQRTFS